MEKHQPTILCVADEPLLRAFLTDLLQPRGYVVECTDAATSLARVSDRDANLVLLDLGWPETTGLELCQRIRTECRTRHVPIVALTEMPDESRQVTAFTFGPDEYLTKPFDIDTLLTAVACYCS
jgi:DNA-binding response OmpR family regulator